MIWILSYAGIGAIFFVCIAWKTGILQVSDLLLLPVSMIFWPLMALVQFLPNDFVIWKRKQK